jgi:hypothetical protein
MRKLKLEVESLAVESFDTAAELKEERGTVHGNAYPIIILSPLCVPPTPFCQPRTENVLYCMYA